MRSLVTADRVRGDVDVRDPSTIVGQHDQHEEQAEGRRWDGEEVEGRGLRRILASACARRSDGRWWRESLERWRALPAKAREPSGRWVYLLIQANVAGALEVMASPARAMATQIRWQRERG